MIKWRWLCLQLLSLTRCRNDLHWGKYQVMKATFRTPLVAVLGLLAFGCDNPNESSDNNIPDSNNQITLDADDVEAAPQDELAGDPCSHSIEL